MNYKSIYDQAGLENNLEANYGRRFQRCSLSVMDTISDRNITFDKSGISNYYFEYIEAEKQLGLKGEKGLAMQEFWAQKITSSKRKGDYNCILGLSGGADSTYLAYLAKQLNLNPLLVHFDYGWNSEIATRNVENVVKATKFDLYTVVMDWPEFKHLQRSYFKASVLDLDVPADHMIFGSLFRTAMKYKIKYVLSGNNIWTEHTLPREWNYNKFDLVNLRNIHRKFENTTLKHLPALGLWHHAYYQFVWNINLITFLNWQEYNRSEIFKTIENEMGWINYGGKHQESVFTRFYQGYILPKKFNIDKRKAHLSNLIFSGQLTREEALKELSEPAYELSLMKDDFEFVAKKLGFTNSEFEEVLSRPNIPHDTYGTDKKQREMYFRIMKSIKPITSLSKKILKR